MLLCNYGSVGTYQTSRLLSTFQLKPKIIRYVSFEDHVYIALKISDTFITPTL